MLHYHLHSHQVIFGIYAIIQLIFIFGKWPWISKALSKDGEPSSMRLSGFMFSQLVCFCEVWHTLKTERFDTVHLGYFLISIGALYGIITAAQALAFKNGTKETVQVETENKKVTATTETTSSNLKQA